VGFRQGALEGVVTLRDRAVLVTGHTGFKGGWLALWLAELGARVHGYALDPPTQPSLFEVAGVGRVLASDTRADLRDLPSLTAALDRVQAEVVFHLAAQPLVSEGYRDPLGTIATNVVGTAHLLEAIRAVPTVRAVVVVATDKVYENRETGHAFSEADPLGGHDPYSASKAATEIMVASYRSSFFGPDAHPARVASARAGNVIGGGDWADHRLVPDCLRAFADGEPVHLRRPEAVRPWQHVLGPLAGYLVLAERLLGDGGEAFARAWNFGPDAGDYVTVREVADGVAARWGGSATVVHDPAPPWDEADLLRLDSTRARAELGWRPRWSLAQTLEQTVAWHQAWLRGEDMAKVSAGQIAAHGVTDQ
jgi:CDP-glucose 4,6-dehydratase